MTRFMSLSDLEAQIGKRVTVQGNRVVTAGAGAGDAVPAEKARAGAPGKSVARDPQDSPRMNKTERRYRDEVLMPALRAGTIRKFRFEALNLRLGEKTFHRPDFYVVLADGAIEIHEVKGGYVRDDAKMKFKVAAADWDEYRWQMWQWDKRKWTKILEL